MAWVGDIRVPFPHHGGAIDGSVLWIVAHSLECDAVPGLGEDLARGYFQNDQVSVHCVSDPKNTVAGLDTGTKGWHAGTHGNNRGNADEVTGRAGWDRATWVTGNPRKALERQAIAMAGLAKANGFQPREIRWLAVAEVQAQNVRGMCYHYDLTRAFPADTTHWDPGPGYPADIVMNTIRWYAGVADFWGLDPGTRPDGYDGPGPGGGGAEGDWFSNTESWQWLDLFAQAFA